MQEEMISRSRWNCLSIWIPYLTSTEGEMKARSTRKSWSHYLNLSNETKANHKGKD